MIYGSIRVHTGPYGPIFLARGEKSQVEKVKINISDRDFFLGLFQGDLHNTSYKYILEKELLNNFKIILIICEHNCFCMRKWLRNVAGIILHKFSAPGVEKTRLLYVFLHLFQYICLKYHVCDIKYKKCFKIHCTSSKIIEIYVLPYQI